jgi:GT2 family glycosyltransferase
MISVIIPTMWRSEGLIERLEQLSKIKNVGEIILIDNTEQPPQLNIKKLFHIKELKNTYVNPAWNKGVALARYDNICILNDDIHFEDSIFEYVEPHISADVGMIGLYQFEGTPYFDNDKGFKLVDTKGWRCNGYACMFFIHRNSYVKIPESIKVWYGDDYLFFKNGKPNYFMQNINVWGPTSITSNDPSFDKIKANDKLYYGQLLNGSN